MSGSAPQASATYRPGRPLELSAGLAPLRRGRADPTFATVADGPARGIWRAARTPAGPASVHLAPAGTGILAEVTVRAWGPGAGWAIETAPALLGALDDPGGFRPLHPVVERTWRAHPGLFLPRTGLVLDSLVPAVIEQKVTGKEARRSWRELVTRFGEPAPGPVPPGLRVPPDAAGWLAVTSWQWHQAGVDPARARAVRAAAAVAGSLERLAARPVGPELLTALQSLPGVGPWTAAETAQRAFGDPDAVSVGDFHLASHVGWALAGQVRSTDEEMLALLEGYRPQRQRAVRLLELADLGAPRFGPRMPVRSYRGL